MQQHHEFTTEGQWRGARRIGQRTAPLTIFRITSKNPSRASARRSWFTPDIYLSKSKYQVRSLLMSH